MNDQDVTQIEVAQTVFEGWTVSRACLHQAIQLPNGGDTTASLYSSLTKGIGKGTGRSGVNMKYNSDGLFCEYKGVSFVVPLANVIVAYIGG